LRNWSALPANFRELADVKLRMFKTERANVSRY